MLLNKLGPIISPKLDDLTELGCMRKQKLSANTSPEIRMASVMLARYDTVRNACTISWSHTANQIIKDNDVALRLTKVSDFYSEYSNPNTDNNSRMIALFEQLTHQPLTKSFNLLIFGQAIRLVWTVRSIHNQSFYHWKTSWVESYSDPSINTKKYSPLLCKMISRLARTVVLILISQQPIL